MKTILLSLLLVPVLAVSADAAQAKKPGKGHKKANPAAAFKKLDTSADGALSLDEFKASPHAQKKPDKGQMAFGKLDKDSDGKLTLEEFKAGAHHPKKQGKPVKSAPAAPVPEAPQTGAPKSEEPKKTV